MHEAQVKEASETQKEGKKVRNQRPYQYYVAVTHRPDTSATAVYPIKEFLAFEDKAAMRDALGKPEYDGASLRIIRGYEMKVQAKRHISIN